MQNLPDDIDELKERVRMGAHAGEYSMRQEFMPAFSTTRISDADLEKIYQYVDGL
jgi:hypothetical protein